MPSRESSQEVDAVFFNPAGLVTGLDNGLHFQINNQFQFIRKGMTATYPNFNDQSSYYDFSLNNLTFPTLFAAWKRDRLAFSMGVFAAMGGGGGAAFPNLPSAELPLADMKTTMSGVLGIYDNYYRFDNAYSDIRYRYDFVSEGLAFSPGVQLVASYAINENWAVAAGVRFVTFISNAQGYAQDIEVYNEELGVGGSPSEYLNYLLAEEGETIRENPLRAGIIEIDGAELLTTLATVFDELIPSTLVDVQQNGRGFTPIINIQYNWDQQVYATFKYEHRTKIELQTRVNDDKDGAGIYEDGRISRSDLPGFFSLGVRYEPNDRLTVAAGHRTIFYNKTDWNGREDFVDRNFLEFTGSVEYWVHPKLAVSAGYTFSEAKLEDEYQNEVDYVLPGHTFAMGAQYQVGKNVSVEAGLINVIYQKQEFEKNYSPFGGQVELPEFFDQTVQYEADGRVMLFSIGATIGIPGQSN